MQEIANPTTLRNEIISIASSAGIDQDCFIDMLDYTIEIFETQGLGAEYYGYHNIEHELEVTYVALLAANWKDSENEITKEDMRYLFAAALFHDFDPQKSVDKPHELNVIKFLSTDLKVKKLIQEANLDLNIIISLIWRTTFPWAGKLKENAELKIKECYENSPITKDDPEKQAHFGRLGWYLSVVDRVSGYALGDFSKAMEMSQKNAHALAWHPTLIIRRSVAYFEDLLNNETEMCERVLRSLPKHMRKNFMDTVLEFFKLRQKEIQIQSDFVYENLKLKPTIEPSKNRNDPDFIRTLREIYNELPMPLQFEPKHFEESITDPETILCTLRLDDENGTVIGFAKGGPLERYHLRPEVRDENFGLHNTIFLEPIAIKSGYWGLYGGSELRHLFSMQGHAKKYRYLTSFALRDVIAKRSKTKEGPEIVFQFDPERRDYYRVEL